MPSIVWEKIYQLFNPFAFEGQGGPLFNVILNWKETSSSSTLKKFVESNPSNLLPIPDLVVPIPHYSEEDLSEQKFDNYDCDYTMEEARETNSSNPLFSFVEVMKERFNLIPRWDQILYDTKSVTTSYAETDAFHPITINDDFQPFQKVLLETSKGTVPAKRYTFLGKQVLDPSSNNNLSYSGDHIEFWREYTLVGSEEVHTSDDDYFVAAQLGEHVWIISCIEGYPQVITSLFSFANSNFGNTDNNLNIPKQTSINGRHANISVAQVFDVLHSYTFQYLIPC